MTMKNKLYKHHRNKALFVLRKFSFVLLGFVGMTSAIAIPTYISSIQESQISTKAQEKEENEEASENLDNIEEEEALLSY